jgi:phosphoribosylaminoimidazole-succinocarboxamide synthase
MEKRDSILLTTEFPEIKLLKKGKVRDVYDLGDNLLIVATDRISCFDVVLGCGIPEKGRVLTAISLFWFEYLKNIVVNHLVTADVDKYPESLKPYKKILAGRSMLVKKAKSLPIECIVRGYLSGSGWKEYRDKASVCGVALPKGLKESEKLPQPIFTPSTKAESGHDLNINDAEAKKLIGEDAFCEIKEKSLALYVQASRYAETKGIIIADTKFEFGYFQNKLILIDEALTPDSSRFWPKESYRVGASCPSFDKQFMRDYLESLKWDKTPPAPEVSEEIIKKTSEKYLKALKVLVG